VICAENFLAPKTVFPQRAFVVFWAAALFLLLTCFAQAQDMGALVHERCLDCHDMDRVCLVASDDTKWWQDTVVRMIQYKADLLTPAEADAMGAFLADKNNRAPLCPKN